MKNVNESQKFQKDSPDTDQTNDRRKEDDAAQENPNTGARPPKEEDYDFEEDPQAEKINNEKRDEYREKNKNR
jgi:hypothetical protein